VGGNLGEAAATEMGPKGGGKVERKIGLALENVNGAEQTPPADDFINSVFSVREKQSVYAHFR